MSADMETREVNYKQLIQLKTSLYKDLIKNKYNIQFIFNRMNNINCKIIATNHLQFHWAQCIGFTVLHFAVCKMDLEAFDIFLRHGADLTAKNNDGSTALHLIVECKQYFTSSAYISNHNFVHSVVSAHMRYSNYENPVSSDGLSHFHIACAVNNLEVVKGFLQNGISIDHAIKDDSPFFPGFSPLHFAVRYDACEVVEMLLSHGANLHIINAQRITPLRMAFERKLEIVSDISNSDKTSPRTDKILTMFIEIESNNDMMSVDNWGLSHFHIACTLKDLKVAESYLQKVVDINQRVNVDSPLWPGYTSLHFAALCNIETVKLLVKSGADMSIKDVKGVTPLDICLKKYKAKDIYDIIFLNPIWKNIVLSDGKTKLTDLTFEMTNPNQFDEFLENLSENITISDSSLWPGYNPLHLAVIFFNCDAYSSASDRERNKEIIMELHDENPDMLNSKDAHGWTPLHLAFRLKKRGMYEQLCTFLESHANLVDHADEDGLSYVHIAAALNKSSLLKRLLSMSANVNAIYRGQPLLNNPAARRSVTIYSGATPLHFAVANGSVETAKMLLKKGADLHAKDVNDLTPVHSLLLNSEADFILSSPNLRDSVVSGIGLSHLHVACRFDKPKVVKRLLDAGANIDGLLTYRPNANWDSCRFSFLKMHDGYSPLLLACAEDKKEVVKLLLQRGADLWVKSSQGNAWLNRIIEQSTTSFHNKYFDLFVKTLIRRGDLQARLKADVGMTELHIACLICDVNAIQKSLNEGANVDAQVHADSPIFQGYTALHVVVHVSDRYDDVDKAIKLLVEAGADVTVPNVNSYTAVHLAWESLIQNSYVEKANKKKVRLNLLLEAQRDFNVNPKNIAGISHFHVACNVGNFGIAQKFLGHGKIDINQAVDYFHLNVPGYTALHFVANNRSGSRGAVKELRTMDLLLKNGANVNVEDADGETALHDCARFACLDLFERLVRGGADVNKRNALGNAPLYNYLTSDNASVEGLKILLRFGCHLNVFNAITDEGYIGVAACKLLHADMQSFLVATIINFSEEIEADNRGRTILHNLVSTYSYGISVNQYVTLIEQISEADCDVDKQDDSGMTALHMAVKFYNSEGIFGLLMTGADINITDSNGKAAMACEFDICELCEYDESWSDDEYGCEAKCEHLVTLKSLAFYVKKLQLCGLDVDKQNEEFARKVFNRMSNESSQCAKFLRELEIIKSVRIEPHALTLNDFLSENGAVADYPTMSEIKREDVNKFFSAGKADSLRKKFPEAAGILRLQYRKARARPELVEMAQNTMELLMGFRLPEICSQKIVVLLTNSELKSLIASII